MSEEVFEAHIAETIAAGEELTSAGILQIAKQVGEPGESVDTYQQAILVAPLRSCQAKYPKVVAGDPKTVWNATHETTLEFSKVETVTGKDGKTYPATYAKRSVTMN